MFKRFIIATVLTALAILMGATVYASAASAATAKRCATAGKQYQSWVVFAKDRKVGDAKTAKISRRGKGGLVAIEAPGSPHADGRYYLTVKPQQGCEVAKIQVKRRSGSYKSVRSSVGGAMVSLGSEKGGFFPYREVRVWVRRASKNQLPCVVPDIVHNALPSFPPNLAGRISIQMEVDPPLPNGDQVNRFIWAALRQVRFKEVWLYGPPDSNRGRRVSTGARHGVLEMIRAHEAPNPVTRLQFFACSS